MSLDFLCWGDVGWDAYEDEASPRPGGCALNVACALVAAGAARVGVAAPLGPDGRPLRDLLAARGVDVSLLEERPGPSPRQPIRLRPDGERVFSSYQGGVLDGCVPSPGVLAAVERAGLVYLPVFDRTLTWAERALELRAGRPLALDLMNLSDVGPEFVARAMAGATTVFCGLDPVAQATDLERLVTAAHAPGAATLVVTLGPAGARAWVEGQALSQEAPPVPGGRVVDTTGCGDAFAGTWLARRATGDSPQAALQAAGRQAARVAGRRGAVLPA